MTGLRLKAAMTVDWIPALTGLRLKAAMTTSTGTGIQPTGLRLKAAMTTSTGTGNQDWIAAQGRNDKLKAVIVCVQ